MLILVTQVRALADVVYGSLNEPSTETYDDYVESMRERVTTAYEKDGPLCEKPPSATRGITTYEYEPKSIGKASGYTTSIPASLLDAKTNGSESILVPSSLSALRHQLLYSPNDEMEPRLLQSILTK